ncbi:MAG: hypothetical protein KKA05_06500 [Alphaproteobacteria bacterium]|nr:hypothetical protein [Alphaproteobacteria bacterium]
MTPEQLQHALKDFTGTEQWYRHPLFRAFTYTDGVKFIAGEAGAYWMLDLIFGLQHELPKLQETPFQVWDLTVNDDKSAVLTCTDGNYGPVHEHKLTYTDFPLPKFRFYLTNQVLLLPSEY